LEHPLGQATLGNGNRVSGIDGGFRSKVRPEGLLRKCAAVAAPSHPYVPLPPMTGDEFTARYRLREQLSHGDIVSYLASDDRDGDALVHAFRGESAPEFDASLLDEAGGEAVREVLDVEGITVVVTEVIEPFSTFETWVAEHQRTPEEHGPGAFTRIFQVQPPGEPSGRSAEPVEEAGEFTRAFGALQQPPPTPAPPRAEPDRSAELVVPPEAEPPAASTESADDSTSGVAQPLKPPHPAQSAPSSVPPPEPPAEQGTGTFTRIMGAAHESPGSVDAVPPESAGRSPFARSPSTQPPASPGRAPSSAPPGSAPRPPARPGVPPPPRPGGAPPPARPGAPPPPRPGSAPPPAARRGAPPPLRPTSAPPPTRPSVVPPSRSDSTPPPARPSAAPPPPPGSQAAPPPGLPFQAPSPPPPGEHGAEPGPYTRAMRAYKDSGQPRSPSPAGPDDAMSSGYGGTESYLDRLRGRKTPDDSVGSRTGGAPPPPPPQPGMRTTVPSVPSGPSEYTRVIRGAEAASVGRSGSGPGAYGGPPPTPVPPPAPKAAPKPAPPASRTPIIVMLVVAVAVLVAVILFFALRSS